MKSSLLLVVLASQTLAISQTRATIPAELREVTGLSNDQLNVILAGHTGTSPSHAASPSSTCASANTPVIFPNPTLPSRFDLAKRKAFVKRQGTQLSLANEPFRMVGGNIYWLGLDENVIPNPSYPSKRRVLEVLGIVSAMRGTAIRAHTLGVSFGNPLSVEPSLDKFNEAAYESIDFAIAAARVYGIKLVIPLVDNYNWYHGGKYQFIEWAGIPFNGTGADISPDDVGAYFYNTTSIVDSFKRYIAHHLSHVNQFTGIALKDDPTIMAWESGNELSGAEYFLIQDNYKIKSSISYPSNITKLEQGMALVKAANRNYIAGEYDWVGESGGDSVDKFLAAVKDSGFAGDFFWSIFGHDDQCCQYVEHDDGFSFYLQRDANYTAKGNVMINHAKEINSQNLPEILPEIACPAANFPFGLF